MTKVSAWKSTIALNDRQRSIMEIDPIKNAAEFSPGRNQFPAVKNRNLGSRVTVTAAVDCKRRSPRLNNRPVTSLAEKRNSPQLPANWKPFRNSPISSANSIARCERY